MKKYVVGDSALEFDGVRHEPGETFASDADLGWWLDNGFLTAATGKREDTKTDEAAAGDDARTEAEIDAPESLAQGES